MASAGNLIRVLKGTLTRTGNFYYKNFNFEWLIYDNGFEFTIKDPAGDSAVGHYWDTSSKYLVLHYNTGGTDTNWGNTTHSIFNQFPQTADSSNKTKTTYYAFIDGTNSYTNNASYNITFGGSSNSAYPSSFKVTYDKKYSGSTSTTTIGEQTGNNQGMSFNDNVFANAQVYIYKG